VVSTNLYKHSSEPAILTSYDIESGDYEAASDCKIWEAGRATSAAPTFFKPITLNGLGLNGQNYSPGATIANNPSHVAIVKMNKIWRLTDVDCILSLGTGPEGEHSMDSATLDLLGPRGMWICQKIISRPLYFRVQLASYALHIMTGTEIPHQNTKKMVDAFRGHIGTLSGHPSHEVYFRFNVTDASAKAGLNEFKKNGSPQGPG
jgi:predicted acylesterase/phospholipase RssA